MHINFIPKTQTVHVYNEIYYDRAISTDNTTATICTLSPDTSSGEGCKLKLFTVSGQCLFHLKLMCNYNNTKHDSTVNKPPWKMYHYILANYLLKEGMVLKYIALCCYPACKVSICSVAIRELRHSFHGDKIYMTVIL